MSTRSVRRSKEKFPRRNGCLRIQTEINSVGVRLESWVIIKIWQQHKPWNEVAQLCPTLCNPMDCRLQGSSVHGIFQARVREWVAFLSSRDLPDSGIEPRSPTLQADALLSEPPGKPTLCDPMDCSPPGFSAPGDSPGKYTGVGCYALLQVIFPTQGLNLGLLCLLHCRRILYHRDTREAQFICLFYT